MGKHRRTLSAGSVALADRIAALPGRQTAAARLLGCSQQHVSKLMTGRIPPGTWRLRAALARVFGIAPEAWDEPAPSPRRRSARPTPSPAAA